MEALKQDLRYALRGLRRKPLAAAVVILTLALGIGANTAIFSVVNTVLLKPLPFDEADQLVALWETKGDKHDWPISLASFVAWKDQSQSFEKLALLEVVDVNLTDGDEVERVQGGRVSAEFFDLLRVRPGLGRLFEPGDDAPSAQPVAVLSHAFWQTRLGGDERILGRTVKLDGAPYVVVGILPRDFQFLYRRHYDLWLPKVLPTERAQKVDHKYAAIGRLRPGASLEVLRAELQAAALRVQEQNPDVEPGWGATALPLQEHVVKDIRTTLLLVFGAVGLVLLIACVNVVNLLLAKSSTRRHELALRTALGASPRRLALQLFSETGMLGVLGGGLGLILALVSVRVLSRINPGTIPRLEEVGLDARVLGFTLLVSLICGLILGLAPVLKDARKAQRDALGEGSGRSTAGGGQQRLSRGLVVAETALVLVLLVAAGLVMKSFHGLRQEAPGFELDNRVALEIVLPEKEYADPVKTSAFFEQVLDEISTLPGVQGVGGSSTLPISTAGMRLPVYFDGRPEPEEGHRPFAAFDVVTPDYIRTLGVPLLRGRALTVRDRRDSPPVLLINQTMARVYWTDEEALGARIRPHPESPWMTVVGIVGDVQQEGLGAGVAPAMYQPHQQLAFPFSSLRVVVHTAPGRGETLVGAVRDRLKRLDPGVALATVTTLEDAASGSIAQPRFRTALIGAFGLLALILGTIGIYGVVSYLVDQKTQEIGVRVALGAQRRDVLRWVLRAGMGPVFLGTILGLLATPFLGRLISGWLFQVNPGDPLALGSVALLLILVALGATLIPARRAIVVEPVSCLRRA